MKVTIRILATVFLLAVAVCAQNTPTANKVDEITGMGTVNSVRLVEKIQKFAEGLYQANPTTIGVIIVHPGFKFEGDCVSGRVVPDLVTEGLVRKIANIFPELQSTRLSIVRGSLSIQNEVYFWTVPEGATAPKPAEYEPHFPCCCPDVRIIGRPVVNGDTEYLKYTIDSSSSEYPKQMTWSASSGKIISGQGTELITIKVEPGKAQEMLIRLEVGQMNPTCNCPVNFEFRTTFDTSIRKQK